MASFIALLRLGRRSIVKAPLRSLLVVGLIALLVAAGTAFSAVIGTVTPSTADQYRAELGDSSTMISFGSDPSLATWWVGAQSPPGGVVVNPSPASDESPPDPALSDFDYAATIEQVRSELGVELTSLRIASVPLDGVGVGPFGDYYSVPVLADIGLHDPVAEGNFNLISGRLPESADEVTVSTQVASQLDLAVGDMRAHADIERTIVGVVASFTAGSIELVTSPAWESATSASPPRSMAVRLFVDEPWTGAEIQEALISLHSVTDQPLVALTDQANYRIGPRGDLQSRLHPSDATTTVRVIPILLTVVVGVQVSLVAASAFAVAIRRRTREFGQLVSIGADASHVRRLVLVEAALLGSIGAAMGLLAGILVAGRMTRWELFNEASGFGAPLQLTALDVIAPALIGIAASILAAWWPARTIANAPVTSTLAGRLPPGPLRAVTPLRGLIVLGLGTAGFTVLAVELAGSSDSGTSTNLVLIVAACSILAMFGGALMLVGPLLAWVGSRADRFPLFARLITRSSDRHRSRSWVVVGAFIATIALPIIFGASIKAYPGSWDTAAEAPLDGELISMRTASRWWWGTEAESHRLEQQSMLQAFDAEIGAAVEDIVGPLASAQILDLPNYDLVTTHDDYRTSNGITLLVATPQMVELLDLPSGLVSSLTDATAIDLRHRRPSTRSNDHAIQATGQGGGRVPIELIDGPALFSSLVLVSDELVSAVAGSPRDAGTIYRASEAVSADDEREVMSAANRVWVDYREELASGSAPLPVELFIERQPERGPSSQAGRGWSVGIFAAIAALIALITAALAAVEVDGEMRSMVAIGAAPSSRRVMLGGQTLYHLLLAAAIGIPLAILTFWAAARADDNGPSLPTIPWGSIAVMGIVVPVVVAGLVAVVFRNAKPAVSRRLS